MSIVVLSISGCAGEPATLLQPEPQDAPIDRIGLVEVVGWSDNLCTTDTDGLVECALGPPPPPIPLTEVDLSGADTACGLTLEGGIECWGTDLYPGGLDRWPEGEGYVDVAVGEMGCALHGIGVVHCWGDLAPTFDQGPLHATALAPWGEEICVLQDDGQLYCLSEGGPGPPVALGPFVDLIGSAAGICGVDDDGSPTCLHDADAPGFDLPLRGPWQDLALEASHGCGLDRTGAFLCWGTADLGPNDFGQVSGAPTEMDFTDVAVTRHGGCAVDPLGDLMCWGRTP